jgi:hypothetical protein
MPGQEARLCVFAEVRMWWAAREAARWLEHRRKGLVYACRAMCFFCGHVKPDMEMVTHDVCKSCRADHVAKYDVGYNSESELESELA